MPFTPQPKAAGDLIKSADWNTTMAEVVRLENDKVNRSGDTINGALTINGNVSIGTSNPASSLDVNGNMRANRYRGLNSLSLSDYQTANPSSNVYLYSPPNDRDSWLFLDSADTGSNWGIYHRQIDSAVKSLPANSIGFIGGGNSDLKAYICLGDGTAYFKSNVGIGTTSPGKMMHIQGASSAPLMNDGYDRPGLAITGDYPELDLFSGVNNPNHGPTIRLGSYNDDQKTTFKQWVIGTAGRNSSFLDIGFCDRNDANPHAGIRNYNGKTCLTVLASGNVGIGTTGPGTTLDVNGTARTSMLTFNGPGVNSGNAHNHYAIYQEGGAWAHPYPDLVINYHTGIKYAGYYGYGGHRFYTGYNPDGTPTTEAFSVGNGDHNVRVANDLYVGNLMKTSILRLGDKWRISAVGDAHGNDDWLRLFDINNTGYYGGLAAGRLWTAQGFLAGSDARLKKDINTIHGALNRVLFLRGVKFRWENADEHHSEQLGLIAQEVEPHFPELVSTGPNGMKAINYSGFVAPLIEAIKEQQRQLRRLELQNSEQQKIFAEVVNARTGNDFAEYFQSADGKAVKPGTSVVLEGKAIRPAKKGDVPIGVISVNPGVLGGVHLEWPGKYVRDEFGVLIIEEYKEEIKVQKKQKVKRERQKMEKKVVEEETVKAEIVFRNGKHQQVEKKEKIKREVATPVFKEVDLYEKDGSKIVGKHQIPVMETYEEETDVFDEKGMPVLVGTEKFEKKIRPKINPDYDPSKEYIPRDKRPEWNCVGLIGQIPLRRGQPVAPTWVKIKDVSDKVELWLIK